MALPSVRELKWMREKRESSIMLNNRRSWFSSSECQRTFRQDVSELAADVNIFPLELWVKIDPVGQPIKCYSVGSGKHVSSSDTGMH